MNRRANTQSVAGSFNIFRLEDKQEYSRGASTEELVRT